jgi:S1-C subfamily serine protease
METARDLIVYLETQTEVGQTVQVQVIRDGREQTVAVRLRELTQ